MNTETLTQEQRKDLLQRRRIEFPTKYPNDPDFCPRDGRCWSCGRDLVDYYREHYPVAFITGCELCHRSYCD